ncbi:MAG: hypothetical protein AAGA62_16390, partial [Bacteroidota bacterium]
MKLTLTTCLLLLSLSLFSQRQTSFNFHGSFGTGPVVSSDRSFPANQISSANDAGGNGYAQSLRFGGMHSYRLNRSFSLRVGGEIGLHRYEYSTQNFCDIVGCDREGINQLWFSEVAIPGSIQFYFPVNNGKVSYYLGAGGAYTLLLAKHSLNADFWLKQYGPEPFTKNGVSYLVYLGMVLPSR